MNSFIFKYIISVSVVCVLILFADNIKTANLLFIAGCFVLLAFIESWTIDRK